MSDKTRFYTAMTSVSKGDDQHLAVQTECNLSLIEQNDTKDWSLDVKFAGDHRSELSHLIAETAIKLKSESQSSEFTAQKNEKISLHRQGAGRITYNAKRKAKRAATADIEGRVLRTHNPATAETRREQNRMAQEKSRSNKTDEENEIMKQKARIRRVNAKQKLLVE